MKSEKVRTKSARQKETKSVRQKGKKAYYKKEKTMKKLKTKVGRKPTRHGRTCDSPAKRNLRLEVYHQVVNVEHRKITDVKAGDFLRAWLKRKAYYDNAVKQKWQYRGYRNYKVAFISFVERNYIP